MSALRGMKVLLVNSNRMKPAVAPIGLDYLADSLRAAGHQVALLDLCFAASPEQEVRESLATGQPDAIAVSIRNTDDCYLASGSFFLPALRALVATLREGSAAPIVLGGVGFSIMPEGAMEYCGADYGVAGEGEDALPGLLDSLAAGSEPERVPGVLFWHGEGLHRNPSMPVSLDGLPPRSRSLVDNHRYFAEGGQAGFETRRGCPMACTYCADPVSKGRSVRVLPPAAVVHELRALLAQGIDHFHTCDCEFNIPLEHAREVCRAIIDAGLGERMRWYAYCAPVPFDAETAALMRRAGCAGIDFGADSASTQMLARLGRGFGPDALEATARHCREAGIPFMYDLLLGGPGETPATVRESVERIAAIGPDCVGVSLGVRVYEGTALAREVRAMGPLEANAALQGARLDNESLLRPVFYLSPALGRDAAAFVRGLVGDDPRFFLPSGGEESRNYNYNDNDLLVRAIAGGARGAYWDILRRMRAG